MTKTTLALALGSVFGFAVATAPVQAESYISLTEAAPIVEEAEETVKEDATEGSVEVEEAEEEVVEEAEEETEE